MSKHPKSTPVVSDTTRKGKAGIWDAQARKIKRRRTGKATVLWTSDNDELQSLVPPKPIDWLKGFPG